jgi:hypothetical protein
MKSLKLNLDTNAGLIIKGDSHQVKFLFLSIKYRYNKTK